MEHSKVLTASAPKKRKANSLLPDLQELKKSRSIHKKEFQKAVDAVETLRQLKLDDALLHTAEGMRDKEMLLTWLVALYGFSSVMSVMIAVNNLPANLTEAQQTSYIETSLQSCSNLADMQPTELDTLVKISRKCLTDGDSFAKVCTKIATQECTVLSPPVQACLECDRRLVSYHTANVKYYTTSGVKKVEKITLRCQHCRILYNYSQFGDKSESGFRFYPSDCKPAAIEVSDTVYFHRDLLEWQCSLA